MLSVVVPAYNEESRLPIMLKECVSFLEERLQRDPAATYEVIVVDDGSEDKTTEVALQWSERVGSDKLRVLTLNKNRGKGGAVRMGMLRTRGRRLLFADADGATQFKDLEKLESVLEQLLESGQEDRVIVCGSRAHLERDSIAKRSLFRTVLMVGFHACVRAFGARCVRDTQCGFKLLTRSAARQSFRSLHIERWAFDVELLKIAEMLGFRVAEVAVHWTEIEGSKLNPLLASVEMFKDLFLLWLRYKVRAWRIRVD